MKRRAGDVPGPSVPVVAIECFVQRGKGLAHDGGSADRPKRIVLMV